MANVLVEESSLSSIANAIREKNGTTDTYKPAEMATAISNIESGGGGGCSFHDFIPEEDCILSGNCSSACQDGYFGGWLLANYPEELSVSGITDASSMFRDDTTLEEIPFTLDFDFTKTTQFDISYCFHNCNSLKELPPVTFAEYNINNIYNATGLFSKCWSIRELPESWAPFIIYLATHRIGYYNSIGTNMFADCYSLRSIPEEVLTVLGELSSTSSSYYIGGSGFNNCYTLDEIKKLGVNGYSIITSNLFSNTFSSCYRLKEMTFNTDDGIAVKKMKSQTIDLTTAGYGGGNAQHTDYNSGITADKQVTNDTTYQALKDDPDWFTTNVAYSRYNHDSAVNTINSLPDTSAYLTTAGGTNTIKFKGAAGSATDGGAINTLTEEEIAVAAAKGWTVTFT